MPPLQPVPQQELFPAQPLQGVAQEMQVESHLLSRQLALRDLVLTQILCVVGASWVGIAAGLGRAQAVVWIGAMVMLYFPMAVAVYFLNREMPLEGGLYVWARTAFGDTAGFMTAFNIWAYGLVVTSTILYGIPSELAYLIGPSAAWLPENHLAVCALLTALVAILAWATARGLAVGKWIHNVSGGAMLTVFVLLILTPVWALVKGEPIHYAALAMHLPKMNLYSLALMGQMFGALCGLEYIAILAGEANAPTRDIGRSVVISSPVICLMFILGTGSVVAFHEMHPGTAINFIAPIPQTLRLALGDSGLGSVVASIAILLLMIRLIGAASYAFTGATRLPMAAGWNDLIPEWFAKLHPVRKTPTNSIVLSALVMVGLVVLATMGVHAQEAFQVLSNASSELYSLAYLAMFAIPVVGLTALRKRMPAWVAWVCGMGFLATMFAFFLTAYPFVDVVNVRAYAGKILGTTAVANLLGFGFYWWRRKDLPPDQRKDHAKL